MTYRVRFTPAADEDVAAIQDTRTRSAVVRRAYALNTEPVAQGKPLQKDLKGLHSVRAWAALANHLPCKRASWRGNSHRGRHPQGRR